MEQRIVAKPLTSQAFAPFGDVIEVEGSPDRLINAGLCGRFHDRARLDFGDGRAGISVFDAQARAWPLRVDLVERHPEGSQAFMPISGARMIVVVARDESGKPMDYQAFVSQPGQVVNLLRGTWHGVLAPLGERGQFAVLDRIGEGANLEEYMLDPPLWVEPGDGA
ncbi:ureidoglycolate lyase [Oceanicola sp. 502str15]|uniref:ureidoglycolate lyase n=1 Tax=Oceanicola sp. 502str15 TaxID=2696061 RepID=UPI00209536E4|nr:ureidoglycolate lyase [Oceanicola sp. 502str15]MCO6383158.1 ureidoglycolate lyase [Oceanicola sp. 502str15]